MTLLLRSGAKVSLATRLGITPLIAAARSGNGAVAIQLLKAGANASDALPDGETAMMAAALGTFIVKIVLLLAFVGAFEDTTAFNPKAFGLTALACILAYTGAQVVWSMRLKALYVEPDGER